VTTWLSLSVLALAAIGAGRVLRKPAVASELRSRPAVGLGALGAAAALVTALGVGWPGWERLLPLAAAAVAVGGVALAIRSHPGFGHSRGLPPGRLAFGDSLDALANPDFYARAAERWGVIFKMAQFHRPTVCVVDLPLGLDLLERCQASLTEPRLPFGRTSPGNELAFLRNAAHPRHRAVLDTALSDSVALACQPGVRAAIRHQLDTMAKDGLESGIDPDPHLDRITDTSLARAILGIEISDPRLEKLERESYERLVAITRTVGASLLSSAGDLTPAEPSVLAEILAADPSHLDDEVLIGNLVLIALITRSNVRGVLGWTLKEYADHPAIGRAAGEDGDRPADNFVRETLRLHQSEFFYREVVREASIGPYRVPKGWLIRVCVRECHDRPDVFRDPGRFDPARFASRQYPRTEYCPFSDGTHSRFGAELASIFARTLVTTLATGFEIEKLADGPPVREKNRHWSHWRPSRNFRLALTPRDPIDAQLA